MAGWNTASCVRQDQRADAHRQVAVDHLDPGLGHRDRTGRHRRFGGGNLLVRQERVGFAVAARPVRATQARVGQAREAAEHDQVECQEHHHPDQLAVFVGVGRHPDDRQRQAGHEQAHQAEVYERRQVHVILYG
jgi:hypothetical protein